MSGTNTHSQSHKTNRDSWRAGLQNLCCKPPCKALPGAGNHTQCSRLDQAQGRRGRAEQPTRRAQHQHQQSQEHQNQHQHQQQAFIYRQPNPQGWPIARGPGPQRTTAPPRIATGTSHRQCASWVGVWARPNPPSLLGNIKRHMYVGQPHARVTHMPGTYTHTHAQSVGARDGR